MMEARATRPTRTAIPPHISGRRFGTGTAGWRLLGRYVVAQRDKKKQIERLVFPRYHQLDATRKLQAAVLKEGPGGKYLIQHSAGSGKTNSIAWSAHFLSELHDVENKKLFDSVIVVSDRTVIDSQLQEALFDFQRVTGVVATITNESDSKSGELAEALAGERRSSSAPSRRSPSPWLAYRSWLPLRASGLL